MPPKVKGDKKKDGYEMPEKFNYGLTLYDIFQKAWTLEYPIGQGGFSLLYLAKRVEAKATNTNVAEYVVKIEPKENGPLFCEIHFYINCAKEDDLKKLTAVRGLKHLAIPKYISSGSCNYNDKDYRFLVMDRYTIDLESILNKSSHHQINEIGVLCLMRQILDGLRYIHERGYAHGDIKGANLMLQNDKESYLVDYGLANRFMRDGKYQKFESKAERKHNGTIEYTSRDAHDGYQTYPRADLEILGYCIVHWLCGNLPWIQLIKNKEQVQQLKIKSLKNINDFIKCTLGDKISDSIRSFVVFYFNQVIELGYDTEPPYAQIKTKLAETLVSLGHTGADHFGIFNPAKLSTTKFNAATINHIDSFGIPLANSTLAMYDVENKPVFVKNMSNDSFGIPLANSTLVLYDLENKPVFVKKMSNVRKQSVASQTEESYIASINKIL